MDSTTARVKLKPERMDTKTTLILVLGGLAGNLVSFWLEPPHTRKSWLIRTLVGILASIFLGQIVGYLIIQILRVEDPASQAATIASCGFTIGTVTSQLVNYFLSNK